MTKPQNKPITAADVIKISKNELPFCCPRNIDAVWNKHPKVYYPLEEKGEIFCVWCGQHYKLCD